MPDVSSSSNLTLLSPVGLSAGFSRCFRSLWLDEEGLEELACWSSPSVSAAAGRGEEGSCARMPFPATLGRLQMKKDGGESVVYFTRHLGWAHRESRKGAHAGNHGPTHRRAATGVPGLRGTCLTRYLLPGRTVSEFEGSGGSWSLL